MDKRSNNLINLVLFLGFILPGSAALLGSFLVKKYDPDIGQRFLKFGLGVVIAVALGSVGIGSAKVIRRLFRSGEYAGAQKRIKSTV